MQRFFTLGAAACVLSSLALAQSVVVPAGYDTVEGNSSNTFPYGTTTTAWAGLRLLQIYDSSNFTSQSITYPIRISGIRFRQNATTGSWTGGTFSPCTIDMSTAAVDYTLPDAIFDNNHGADRAQVFNGTVTVQAGTGNGTGVPGVFYVDITFGSPFIYDPNSGSDLVVDMDRVIPSWTGGTSSSHDVVSGTGALGSRVFASSNYPLANGTTVDHALVAELVYTPTSGLYASFNATPTSGPIGQTVAFTDTSFTSDPGGVLTWAWDFENDGTVDSTAQNPMHTYNACGSYDVKLTVTDASNPSSTLTRTGLISIGQTPIVPSFTYTKVAPGLYQFTDTSAPTPTTWDWDLDGDGFTDSTAQNPMFAYAPCTVTNVTLSVSDACVGPFTTSAQVVEAPTEFTTSLTPNNGLSSNGAGNVFDIDMTNPQGAVICALTLTPYTSSAGGTITCEVWVTDAPGGYLANHTNAAVWRLAATGTGIDQGVSGAPTGFTLSNPVYVPFGQSSMAISTSQGLRYYTEPVNPGVYPGADFTITTGLGKSSLFSTSANNPRGITASFHYSIIGNGDLAGYGFDGLGCAGSLGQSTLSPDTTPAIGSTINVTVDNCPSNVAIMMTGFSNTTSILGPLPAPLAAYGAPGCDLLVSPDANLLLLGASNACVWSFAVPPTTSLIGLILYNQAVVLDPGFNAAGAVGSDSAAMLIGQ
ncbi:MAG: PKD domain-containing protein [Planctomycetes bacterium]|nr:PKD domain-containing protein [Planctomycetota bacterium]